MKYIKFIFIPLFVSGIFLLSACNCIKGNREQKTELRKVKQFDALVINIPGKVYFTQGTEYFVQVKSDSNLLPLIETNVKRKTLTIELSECVKDFANIEVHIGGQLLEDIEITGSSKFYCENQINSENLDINFSGSGNCEFDLHVSNLESDISGSGKINYRGTAENHELSQSGSGAINAKNLSTTETDIRLKGAGNCSILVTGKLDAKVSGSGNLTYRGNPKKVNTDVTGSGNIRTK